MGAWSEVGLVGGFIGGWFGWVGVLAGGIRLFCTEMGFKLILLCEWYVAIGVYCNLAKRSNRLLSTAQRVIEKKVKANKEAVLDHLGHLQSISNIAEKNRKIEGLEASDNAAPATAPVNIQVNFT